MSRSNLHKVAARFRERILSIDEADVFLGSEQDLLKELDVSRPTFRQVARLLEQEQLLAIRRGPGGGFFTRRPSFEGIAHLMSVSLVSRKARLSHMVEVGTPLMVEAAKMAAALPDSAQRQQPLILLRENRLTGAADRRTFTQLAVDFNAALLALAGNPILEIFMQIILDFASHFDSLKGLTPDRARRYLVAQKRLAIAIREGDPEIAGIMAKRMNREIAYWLSLDEGGDDELTRLHSAAEKPGT
jgi:GntR family transcriptional regulator, transcriptional repressor for pyruvate dehydrogenase complex